MNTGKGDEERRKRLAQALRENLKRRKAQERARKVEDPAPSPEEGAGTGRSDGPHTGGEPG